MWTQYLELVGELEKAETKSVNNLWDAELEYLKKLREKLLGLLPQFPDLKDLLDLLDRIIREKEKTRATGAILLDGQPVIIAQGSANTVVTPPCLTGTMTIAGLGELERQGTWFGADISVELSLNECVVDGGISTSTIKGGYIRAKVVSIGATVYGVLNTSDAPATLVIDGAGNGRIEGWVDFSAPAGPWVNWINGDHFVSIPVSRAPNGHLRVLIGEQFYRQAFPRPYYRAADYNEDGVLDSQSDLASFLAAWAANDPLADRNGDGVWNQTDINLWQDFFNAEASIPR